MRPSRAFISTTFRLCARCMHPFDVAVLQLLYVPQGILPKHERGLCAKSFEVEDFEVSAAATSRSASTTKSSWITLATETLYSQIAVPPHRLTNSGPASWSPSSA